MLWEVTDLEVDKVVSTLLALCVPSAAQVPWPKVGKAKWSQGELGKYTTSFCRGPLASYPDENKQKPI